MIQANWIGDCGFRKITAEEMDELYLQSEELENKVEELKVAVEELGDTSHLTHLTEEENDLDYYTRKLDELYQNIEGLEKDPYSVREI